MGFETTMWVLLQMRQTREELNYDGQDTGVPGWRAILGK
jgi:hypothetical protein